MRGCWPNKFSGEGDARDRPINRRSEYCLESQGGQPMSGCFASGLPPAFGDASVHMRPRMSLLYG
jgi:hypothetical protein